MFYWLFGYKQEDDVKKEDTKENKDDDDSNDIPPPPELKRQVGYYKECKVDDVIKWRDYDKSIAEIREEIQKLKIETDEKWKARLSPVMETRRKKRRKKSVSASNVDIKK